MSKSQVCYNLSLSRKPAPDYLPEDAILSFISDGAVLHLPNKESLYQYQAAQKVGRKLYLMGIKNLNLKGPEWELEFIWALHQGYFNPKKSGKLTYPDLNKTEQCELDFRISAVDWVRNIINLPAGELTPNMLCEKALELIKSEVTSEQLDHESVTAQIISGEDLKAAGWEGIYAVGKGSDVPPAMLILDYNPRMMPDAPVDLALVGKGITFDSGGYSLKSSDGMSVMKSDMGGAATLTGALALAISRGLDKRVVLILCCAENMINGKAIKLGDIIRYKNGVSVEVLNSDAEGRLVLADGLLAAGEFSPKTIIDAATLTGAAKMALGRDYHAVLAYNQTLAKSLLDQAVASHEFMWQLPLAPWHSDCLNSAFADIANIHSGESMPGASTAAAFLAKFVIDDAKSWIHLDLAACYQKNSNDLWATGAKGHGVCTLASFIINL